MLYAGALRMSHMLPHCVFVTVRSWGMVNNDFDFVAPNCYLSLASTRALLLAFSCLAWLICFPSVSPMPSQCPDPFLGVGALLLASCSWVLPDGTTGLREAPFGGLPSIMLPLPEPDVVALSMLFVFRFNVNLLYEHPCHSFIG